MACFKIPQWFLIKVAGDRFCLSVCIQYAFSMHSADTENTRNIHEQAP